MGYYKDNTVEIEVDGVVQRVFNQEAKMVIDALTREGRKVKVKEPIPVSKKEENEPKKQ